MFRQIILGKDMGLSLVRILSVIRTPRHHSERSDMTAIDEIRTRARKYPNLAVVEGDRCISVIPPGHDSFRVELSLADGSHTVYFEGWHEACRDEKAALELFAMGLSDAVRLRVTSRGGRAYKWTAEFREDDEWRADSTTGLLFCRFWEPPVVRYLQNHVLVSSGTSDPKALIVPRECPH